MDDDNQAAIAIEWIQAYCYSPSAPDFRFWGKDGLGGMLLRALFMRRDNPATYDCVYTSIVGNPFLHGPVHAVIAGVAGTGRGLAPYLWLHRLLPWIDVTVIKQDYAASTKSHPLLKQHAKRVRTINTHPQNNLHSCVDQLLWQRSQGSTEYPLILFFERCSLDEISPLLASIEPYNQQNIHVWVSTDSVFEIVQSPALHAFWDAVSLTALFSHRHHMLPASSFAMLQRVLPVDVSQQDVSTLLGSLQLAQVIFGMDQLPPQFGIITLTPDEKAICQ